MDIIKILYHVGKVYGHLRSAYGHAEVAVKVIRTLINITTDDPDL